jgi:hypothetical protein
MKTLQNIVVALSVVTLAAPAFARTAPNVSTQSVQARWLLSRLCSKQT